MPHFQEYYPPRSYLRVSVVRCQLSVVSRPQLATDNSMLGNKTHCGGGKFPPPTIDYNTGFESVRGGPCYTRETTLLTCGGIFMLPVYLIGGGGDHPGSDQTYGRFVRASTREGLCRI